uniref:non-specific serine/threonine protein kinase n=1 Tax=Meloidogyne hapla TaxID=6305 RepID=A0A1I8BS40_MELHA
MINSDNLEAPIYVFQLPARIVNDLSTLLDPGDCWEMIAFLMPGIQDIDTEACKRLSTTSDGHPTETLLRIWGSKGYRILDLYKVFFRAKLIRCMQILLPFVEAKYHKYAQVCEEEPQLAAFPSIGKNNLNNNPNESKKASVVKQGSFGVYSRKASNAILTGLQSTLTVPYSDIVIATNNWAPEQILGKGGYGVVYRGNWKHTEVAVKRIQGKKSGRGEEYEQHQKERLRQSLQELRTLAKFRHDNILSLYGYSLDGPEPCLIYQFMSNGSLEDRLLCRNSTSPLNWPLRLSICKGVSCGLHFLHTTGTMPIIHGDVKSANILLDKHYEPKLGDFGLSRDGQLENFEDGRKPMIASHIKGTLAYLPPEFTTSQILTTKLDVYSFGVVLLEMASGQRAFLSNREPQGLVEYTNKYRLDVKMTENLSDKRVDIGDNQQYKQIFELLIMLGIACTKNDRFLRPTFSQVFDQLEALDKM